MDLYDASMNGLVFRKEGIIDPKPVDFTVSGNGLTLVVLTEWWRNQWGPFEWIFPFRSEVTKTTTGWSIGRHGAVLEPLPDETYLEHIRRARMGHDVYRDGYFEQLDALITAEPEMGAEINEWRERVRARPVIDPVALHRERASRMREIGRVFLVGPEGRKDVLVVDEDGDAFVLFDNPWLRTFADDWMENEERPSIGRYLEWLSERRPPGVLTLDGGRVEQASGLIDDIAARAFGLTSAREK